MVPQPFADLLDPLIILFAELIQVDRVEMIARLLPVEMVLPGAGETLVQVVVQIAVDQHVPLMGFEPDPVAAAAPVEIELAFWLYLVTCHDVPTVRAKLQLVHIPGGIDLNRALLLGQDASQSPPPGHVLI